MTTLGPRTHTPIPSLPGLPLLGNVFALRNDRLELLLRIGREFGDIGAFHFGPRTVPLINSPDLVRGVLVDQSVMFEKTATVRKLAIPVLGNGVFLSEGYTDQMPFNKTSYNPSRTRSFIWPRTLASQVTSIPTGGGPQLFATRAIGKKLWSTLKHFIMVKASAISSQTSSESLDA